MNINYYGLIYHAVGRKKTHMKCGYMSKITLVVSKTTILPRYQVNLNYWDNLFSFEIICKYDYLALKELIQNISYSRIVCSRVMQQRYYVNYHEM